MTTELPIILTFDAKFARPAYTLMQSIIETAPINQKHHFYVLHEKLPTFIIDLGHTLFDKKTVSITFVDMTAEMSKIRITRYTNTHPSIFYRLFIPELFKEFDQVLYLDCDTIVIQNIYEISKEIKETSLLGAVADPFSRPTHNYVSFLDDIPYFNAGVLYFRPKKTPAKQRQLCLQLCARPYPLSDQDIFNLIYHDDFTLLSKRWNFTTGRIEEEKKLEEKMIEERNKERQHARIFHFIGPKPWSHHVLNDKYYWQYDSSLSSLPDGLGELFSFCLELP